MAEAPSRAPFPETQRSLIARIGSDDAEVRRNARETIARAYWAPIYTYVRLRFRLDRDQAADAAQEFFAREITRDLFAQYDPAKAKFRTFVRLCLDSFLANEREAAHRLKRGGDAHHVAIEDAERVVVATSALDDADALFEREWMRTLFGSALATFRQRCEASDKVLHYTLFVEYDVEGAEVDTRLTYSDLAAKHGIATTQVTNHLHWARRQFRTIVLDVLREQCANDEEFRSEAQSLFGVSR